MERLQAKLPAIMRELEFTTRELEVLLRLGCAYSRKEIYESLNMAERTLNTHMSHISMKTGYHGYSALVRFAQEYDFGQKQGSRITESLSPSMLSIQKLETVQIIAET
jgi:DNA-binding NarL/FixJ family response regulator